MQRTRMMGLATALALTTLLTLATPNVTHAQSTILDAASTAQGSQMDVSPQPWVDAVSVVAVLEVAQAQELVHTLFPNSVFSQEPKFLLHHGVWVYEFVGTEGTFRLDAVTGAVLDDASRAPAYQHDVLLCSDTEGTCDSAAQIDWYNVDCHNDKFMCAFTIAPACSQTECLVTDPAVHPCPSDVCDVVDPIPSELSPECTSEGAPDFTCVVPIDCTVIDCDALPAYPVDESRPFLCGMLRVDGTVGCPDSNETSLPAIDPCATEACQAVPESETLDSESVRTPDGTDTSVVPGDCSLVFSDATDSVPGDEAAFPRDIPAANSSSIVPEPPIHAVGPTGIDGTFPDDASADYPVVIEGECVPTSASIQAHSPVWLTAKKRRTERRASDALRSQAKRFGEDSGKMHV